MKKNLPLHQKVQLLLLLHILYLIPLGFILIESTYIISAKAFVDVPTKVRRCYEGHKGEAFSVTYNLAGTLLATGGHDTYVKIWDGRSCL